MQGITSQQAARVAAVILGLLSLRLLLFVVSQLGAFGSNIPVVFLGFVNPIGYGVFYWVYSQPLPRRRMPLKTAALVAICLGVAPGFFVQVLVFASFISMAPLGYVLAFAGWTTSLVSILFYLRMAGKLPQVSVESLAKWLLILVAIGAIDNAASLMAWARQTIDGSYAYEWSRDLWNGLLGWSQTPLLCLSIAAQLLFYWSLMREQRQSAASMFSSGGES